MTITTRHNGNSKEIILKDVIARQSVPVSLAQIQLKETVKQQQLGVEKGYFDDSNNNMINLDNLNTAAIFYVPGNMFTGPKWKTTLYLDERANKEVVVDEWQARELILAIESDGDLYDTVFSKKLCSQIEKKHILRNISSKRCMDIVNYKLQELKTQSPVDMGSVSTVTKVYAAKHLLIRTLNSRRRIRSEGRNSNNSM